MTDVPPDARPFDVPPGDPLQWLSILNAQRKAGRFLARAGETHRSLAKKIGKPRSSVTHFLHADQDQAHRTSFQEIAQAILRADLVPGGVVLAEPPGEQADRDTRFVHAEIRVLRSLRQADDPAGALYTLVGRCEHLLRWQDCPGRPRLVHNALMAAAAHVEDPERLGALEPSRLEEVLGWVDELAALLGDGDEVTDREDPYPGRARFMAAYVRGCLGLALGRPALAEDGLDGCLARLATPPAESQLVREGRWENTLVLLERVRAAGALHDQDVRLGLLALAWLDAGQGSVVAEALRTIDCQPTKLRWWNDTRLNRLFDDPGIELDDEDPDTLDLDTETEDD